MPDYNAATAKGKRGNNNSCLRHAVLNPTDDKMTEDNSLLVRIADALEILAGTHKTVPADFSESEAFVWRMPGKYLQPVGVSALFDITALVGIDHQIDILRENTLRFAEGKPANNALLWGARGMGKSTLVRELFKESHTKHEGLRLIEIYREDLSSLPDLLDSLRAAPNFRFLLFCDDLSFDAGDASYKSLKAVLEGGVAARPDNVLFYATSNRRHLMPRDMVENEQRTGIHPGEATEEKVSLSDRFGLWLGFHPCSQEEYLAMVDGYAKALNVKMSQEQLHRAALEWSITRGARSGRVAWQFIQSVID